MPHNPQNLKCLPMEVITVNPKTGDSEQVESCDFANPHARRWLERKVFWAWYNGKGIALNPMRSDMATINHTS